MGATAMVVHPDPTPDTMWTADIDKPDCLAVYHPAERLIYQGSGWRAVQTQMLNEPGETWAHSVSQSVISFSSAQAATEFASRQSAAWQKCLALATPITITDPNQRRHTFTVERADTQNGTLTAQYIFESIAGWGCQRALTTHNNVVIDVRACSNTPADQEVKVAAAIAGRTT